MGDTISRQAAIDTLMEKDKKLRNINWYDKPYAEAECRGIDEALSIISNLPSAQPEQDREFMKLTVRNSNGRPYYSIIYLEFDDNGIGNDFEGYSSYSLDVISDYLKKYFMQSAEPERTKERTETRACDCISRQAAIDLFPNDALEWDTKGGYIAPHLARRMIEELPSVQPERKKGKWIEVDYPDNRISGRCSICDWEALLYETDVVGMDYCPNCGADMRGESGGD